MKPAEGAADGDGGDLVGVVGDEGATEGGIDDDRVIAGSIEDVLERSPSLLVCVGARALSALARRDDVPPVLAVEVDSGLASVSRDRLPAAIDAVRAGRSQVHALPVLEVTIDGVAGSSGNATQTTRALFDVTLVTDEPARISEYSLDVRGERHAQFRADGVVVATPQGSHGYASAVGGPLVSDGLDAVCVAPIAPFVTRTRRWVLPDDELTLRVERDEGPVVVQADDRLLETISADSTVSIGATASLSILEPHLTDER